MKKTCSEIKEVWVILHSLSLLWRFIVHVTTLKALRNPARQKPVHLCSMLLKFGHGIWFFWFVFFFLQKHVDIIR